MVQAAIKVTYISIWHIICNCLVVPLAGQAVQIKGDGMNEKQDGLNIDFIQLLPLTVICLNIYVRVHVAVTLFKVYSM